MPKGKNRRENELISFEVCKSEADQLNYKNIKHNIYIYITCNARKKIVK